MDGAKQLLEDFVAGRLDAATFQARCLAVWRDMRDRGERWVGEVGQVLASIFVPAECFDPDLAPGETSDAFTLDEGQFRAEVLEFHKKLRNLRQAA